MAFSERLSRLRGMLPEGPSLSLSPELEERLIGCMPSTIGTFIANLNRRLVIELEGSAAKLSFVTGGNREPLGLVNTAGELVLPPAILDRGRERRYVTELVLPAHAVVTRSVTLPAQVRGNLRQVLHYELDRLTPFSVDDVYYEYRLQPAAKNAERIMLDLALCRRDAVVDWISRFQGAGHPLDCVGWQGAWQGANLLPPEARPRAKPIWQSHKAWMILLAVVLLGAVLATPLYQRWQYVRYLVAEVRTVQTRAIAVDDLRQELERARQGSTAILQQKLDQPLLLDLLRELTTRLPDDTWVQGLEYNQGEVELRGESAQATGLIALLEQAPGIDDVSFKSPVVQVARTGKERFNIGFRYVRQGNP